MRGGTRRFLVLALGLAGCGYGSLNPVVANSTLHYDSRLLGTWEDSLGVVAVVTKNGAQGYDILYRDDDGRHARYYARLGRIGTLEVLDLEPAELPDSVSDDYKSQLLPLHFPAIIDSVGETLSFRLPDPDSIKSYLKRHPDAAHVVMGDSAPRSTLPVPDEPVLLTGSTAEVQRFLAAALARPGVLVGPWVWHRAAT